MNRKIVAFSSVGLVFMVLLIMRVGSVSSQSTATKTGPIPENEYDPAVWGKHYPLEYKSFQRNLEMAPSPTGYGGGINYQKSEKEPEILINFKGFGFSKDYTEDRGHPYALGDLLKSKRVTPKTPGACMTCKTPYLKDFFQEMGWNYAKKPLTELPQSST